MTAPSAPSVVACVPSPYVAQVERSGPTTIAGFIYHPADHAARPVVELLIDGLPMALARAEIYRSELERAGIGDGRYGFSFVLAPEVVSGGGSAQVVIANLDLAIAPPIALARPAAARERPDGEAGGVEWTGGLRVSGWLAPSRDPARLRVRVRVDGELIVDAPPDRWRQRGRAGATPAFALNLPERLATGQTQQVVVTDGAGTPLRGSPLTLVAFPDPLEALVARACGPDAGVTAMRARLFDALAPRSLPFAAVASWLRQFPPPAPIAATRRVALAMVGDAPADVARTRDSLGGIPGATYAIVALPSPDRIGFAPADLLGFLDGAAADCDSLLLVPAGAVLEPGAAGRFAETLDSDREARLIYGDLIVGSPDHQAVLAFPSFDYERWLEQGYGALLFALPLHRAAEAARAGADSLYRLANAQFDDLARARATIVHRPGVAATVPALDLPAAARHLADATRRHLAARSMPAHVAPMRGSILPAVRVTREQPHASVSVIVPVRDRAEWLSRCLTSIQPALDRVGAECIVVDNGSSDPETLALLDRVRAGGGRVLVEPGPFNHARLINRAVTVARGDLVCLLHDDVEAREDGWLAELMSRMREPTTAATGAVLRWPSGVVQHAGIVLGPRLAAVHAFTDRMADADGYGDLLRVASEPSAATAACLLVRAAAFRAVGGLDERLFPNALGAVDLCLKLCARGERVVLTPHLDLVHHSASSDPEDGRAGTRSYREREVAALGARWGEALLADPAYNPLLALSETAYGALACPPRSFTPRRRGVTPPAALPSGL